MCCCGDKREKHGVFVEDQPQQPEEEPPGSADDSGEDCGPLLKPATRRQMPFQVRRRSRRKASVSTLGTLTKWYEEEEEESDGEKESGDWDSKKPGVGEEEGWMPAPRKSVRTTLIAEYQLQEQEEGDAEPDPDAPPQQVEDHRSSNASSSLTFWLADGKKLPSARTSRTELFDLNSAGKPPPEGSILSAEEREKVAKKLSGRTIDFTISESSDDGGKAIIPEATKKASQDEISAAPTRAPTPGRSTAAT